MPAPIPPTIRKKLQTLRGEGHRISEIAKELGLARSTVARYTKDVDDRVELESAPAAKLSDREVLKLRWLASQLEFTDCGECGSHLVVDVTRQQGRCHKCGSGWELTLHTSTARQAS